MNRLAQHALDGYNAQTIHDGIGHRNRRPRNCLSGWSGYNCCFHDNNIVYSSDNRCHWVKISEVFSSRPGHGH